MNKNNTTQWTQWLVELMDAEGNFQVFPKKRTNVAGVITSYSVGINLYLGMHIRELPIILDIQSRLGGIGNVYQDDNKNEVHYAVSSRDDIKQFIVLVLSQHALLTTNQLQRFNLLNYVIKNDIRKVATRKEYDALVATNFDGPVLTNLSQEFLQNWIKGFINGEGSFQTSQKGVFTFALEHTDKPVIELMQKFFGPLFNTYDRKQRNTRKLTYVIQGWSVTNIRRVVEFMDSAILMQGYKLREYTKWRTKWLTKKSDK